MVYEKRKFFYHDFFAASSINFSHLSFSVFFYKLILMQKEKYTLNFMQIMYIEENFKFLAITFLFNFFYN